VVKENEMIKEVEINDNDSEIGLSYEELEEKVMKIEKAIFTAFGC
jgi:hypothetical protein